MIPEIDIWRAATLMLKRYGEKALEQSSTRADELAAEGDHDGDLAPDCRCRGSARQQHNARTAALIGTHPKRSRQLPPALFLITDFIGRRRHQEWPGHANVATHRQCQEGWAAAWSKPALGALTGAIARAGSG